MFKALCTPGPQIGSNWVKLAIRLEKWPSWGGFSHPLRLVKIGVQRGPTKMTLNGTRNRILTHAQIHTDTHRYGIRTYTHIPDRCTYTHINAYTRTDTHRYAQLRAYAHRYAHYAQIHTYTHILAQIRTDTHIYTQIRTDTHIHAQIRTYAQIRTDTRTDTHGYTQIRTDTHIYTHIRMHKKGTHFGPPCLRHYVPPGPKLAQIG
jgi:hypothetical protein